MAARDTTLVQGLSYPLPARRQGVRIALGRLERRVAPAALIALMTVGSFAMWTVVPAGGLWLASQLSDSFVQLSAVAALAAVVAIPAGMLLTAKLLAQLELIHARLTGRRPPSGGRYVPAWRRSVSDSRSGKPAGVLDRIMAATVLAAAIGLVGWFVLFAGQGGAS